MELEKVAQLVDSEFQFLIREHDNWSLTKGDQDMELVAHALRVLIQIGKVKEYEQEFLALVNIQHEDGGWGQESNTPESAAWVTAFCGLVLLRGNLTLKNPEVEASVNKCIDYFLNTQKENGRWTDPSWGDLDTTSHPVSLFNIVLAIGTDEMKDKVRESWKSAIQFIIDGQSEDGGWYDVDFHPSGVETTAHLGQDSLAASFTIEDGIDVAEPSEKSLDWILEHQSEDGSWDKQNMDHTMDCLRSTLLLSRSLGLEEKVTPTVEKAVDWIVENKTPEGWPDFPGEEMDLERTCDGLDVLLKYEAWKQADKAETARRWGYVPGEPTWISASALA